MLLSIVSKYKCCGLFIYNHNRKKKIFYLFITIQKSLRFYCYINTSNCVSTTVSSCYCKGLETCLPVYRHKPNRQKKIQFNWIVKKAMLKEKTNKCLTVFLRVLLGFSENLLPRFWFLLKFQKQFFCF